MPLDSLWREREFTQPQCELCRDPNFDVVHFQNGFLKRLPHNERKSSALSKLLKSDRFWAVFSVHDDLHPFLELWNEPTEVAAGKPPQYVFPLAVCQHIRSVRQSQLLHGFLPSPKPTTYKDSLSPVFSSEAPLSAFLGIQLSSYALFIGPSREKFRHHVTCAAPFPPGFLDRTRYTRTWEDSGALVPPVRYLPECLGLVVWCHDSTTGLDFES